MADQEKLPVLYCSFCGKSQHEVRKLIAAPTTFICDECVEKCYFIVLEMMEDLPPPFTMKHLIGAMERAEGKSLSGLLDSCPIEFLKAFRRSANAFIDEQRTPTLAG